MKRTRDRRASFLPIALALLAGCGLVSRDEVARVASPDGRIEAVLIETNGGATTSFGYEVHVVPKGRPASDQVAWLYGAVRNENAYGANLEWTDDYELVIEYLDAREQRLERASVSGTPGYQGVAAQRYQRSNGTRRRHAVQLGADTRRPSKVNGYAATLHSSHYRRLHTPATTFKNSRED